LFCREATFQGITKAEVDGVDPTAETKQGHNLLDTLVELFRSPNALGEKLARG